MDIYLKYQKAKVRYRTDREFSSPLWCLLPIWVHHNWIKLEEELSFDEETRHFSVSVRLLSCVDLLYRLGRTFAPATLFQGPRSSAYAAVFASTNGSFQFGDQG